MQIGSWRSAASGPTTAGGIQALDAPQPHSHRLCGRQLLVNGRSTRTKMQVADTPVTTGPSARASWRLHHPGRASLRLGSLLALLLLAAPATSEALARSGAVANHVPGSIGPSSDELDRLRIQEAARRRSQETESAREERKRLRRLFHGLSDGDALALARQQHPRVFAGDVWSPFKHVTRRGKFVNRYSAPVTLPDGTPAVAVSNLPVGVLDTNNELQPADLSLRSEKDGWKPARSSVRTSFPKRSSSAVVIGDLSIKLGGDALGHEVNDRVFYPDAGGEDVDLLFMPTPTGLESFAQIRSTDAPEELRMSFELPDGAELKYTPAAPNGPIQIVDGARVIASITEPTAVDAEQRRVEVGYRVEGRDLVMTVRHRSADYAMPVMVDPTVVYGWNNTPQRWDAAGWGVHQNTQTPWCITFDSWYLGRGFYAYSRAGDPNQPCLNASYQHNEILEFNYYAEYARGSTAFVAGWDEGYTLDIGYGGVCHYSGVYSMPLGRFETYSGAECQSIPNNVRYHRAYGTSPNYAVFGTVVNGSGRREVFTDMLWGATVYVSDRDNPTVEQGPRRIPVGWTADTVLDVTSRDAGIGTDWARIRLAAAGSPDETRDQSRPCSADPQNHCRASETFGFGTTDLPEGERTVDAQSGDLIRVPDYTRLGVLRLDRTAPTLSVSGDLRNLTRDDSGRDLYPLVVSARDGLEGGGPGDQRSGVASVTIAIDGREERTETSDVTCEQSCSVTIDDFTLDTDWLAEGRHVVSVSARDRLGHTSSTESWAIEVVRDNYFGQQLGAWETRTEAAVDSQIPGVPLDGRIPPVPSDWRRSDMCESTEAALRSCYANAKLWGREVHEWLERNLPAGFSTPENLQNPPTFKYALGQDDTSKELSHRYRDYFDIAKRSIAGPADALDVAVGFHRPIDPQQLSSAIPQLELPQAKSALSGIFGPGGADWQGSVRIPVLSSITQSVDDFYAKQGESITRTIAELEQEAPADAEEGEDIAAVLNEARAFRAHLQAGGGYVSGVALRLNATAVVSLLQTSANEVKSIVALPSGSDLSVEGADALGSSSVDEAVVRNAARRSGGGAVALRAGMRFGSAQLREAAAPYQPTCDQRGESAIMPRSILQPNPTYWSPSRHKADSALIDRAGSGYNKEHRLRFRWQAARGLAFMCADAPGDRNVEIEATVFPSDAERWSTNWESNDARRYTMTNMPGNIHQDDIASGGRYPFDKQRYPDFAILAQSSRAFRYRKLYVVDFTTNQGEQDAGTVIYSGQPVHRYTQSNQETYCEDFRRGDYKSCMFSQEDLCWAHRRISDGPVYSRRDWTEIFGLGGTLRQAAKKAPGAVDGRKVVRYCDPRPDNSGAG